MDTGEGLHWLLLLEPKGSHTEGRRNESSIFHLWVASSRGTLILLLDSLRSAIWKLHTAKCPRVTRPMPIEPTSGTALVRGQCLTNTSAKVWQQIWAQNYMHWGAGHERYHGAVSWSPAPNPQLSRKPPAEHTILGLRLESIGRDARTTLVSYRYLCTLSLDIQFLALASAQGTSTWLLRQCMTLSLWGRLGSSMTSALLAKGQFLPLVSWPQASQMSRGQWPREGSNLPQTQPITLVLFRWIYQELHCGNHYS